MKGRVARSAVPPTPVLNALDDASAVSARRPGAGAVAGGGPAARGQAAAPASARSTAFGVVAPERRHGLGVGVGEDVLPVGGEPVEEARGDLAGRCLGGDVDAGEHVGAVDPLTDVLDLSRVRGALIGPRARAPWGLELPESSGAPFHAV